MPARGKDTNRKSPPAPQTTDSEAGFYNGCFTPIEKRDLAQLDALALDAEINMLRVSTRRVFELTQGVAELGQAIEALRVLGLAATRLSSLLRSQRDLQQQASQAIQQALQEVLEEMNLS